MKNLVVDIGNSRTKAAVLDEGKIVEKWSFPEPDREYISPILRKYPSVTRCIISSTRTGIAPVEKIIEESVPFVMRMENSTPVPIKNLYRTPATLGPDRLAAAVGAGIIFPGENVMVADLGTAITIDFVTAEGEFLGGSISPGIRLRFRALHEYTGKLPLGSPGDSVEGIASTTGEAVANGVMNGIAYELEGYRNEFARKMKSLKVILTGGDADFFVKRFKNTIFANYDLVIQGLNRILDYNAPKQ